MDEDSSTTFVNGSAAAKEAMDKLVPGLNPNEYGKMPATYYANSQKVAPITIGTDVVEETTPSQTPNAESPKHSTSEQVRAASPSENLS